MLLTELTALIYEADKKQEGCVVELTTITVPGHQHGQLYGVLKYGHGGRHKRLIRSEEELISSLKAASL